MLRLSAQSFGFAPAKSANIHPADSFVWVERTSPCSRSVTIDGQEKKPSDFCREILVRNEAYTKIGSRCVWYSDESWTTTSPHYEFLLNIAEDRFLASRNVRRYSISHNNAVLAFWERQDGTSVHYFEVKNADSEKPEFTRKLAPGIDPSRAFDVARALGLDSDFIALGEKYIAGQFAVRPAPVVERALTVYDQVERARLKLLPQSLRSLIPQSDELMLDESGGFVRVRWRSDVDKLVARDDRYTPLRDGHPAFQDSARFPFICVSSNNDHFPRIAQSFRFAQNLPFRASEFISGLLYFGASSESRELFERRQLFTELAKPGVLETFREQLTYLRDAIYRIGSIGHVRLQDFPATLSDALDTSVKNIKSYGSGFSSKQNTDGLKLVKAAVTLIKNLCDDSDKKKIVDERLDVLTKIIALEEERGKFHELRFRRDELSDEERKVAAENLLRINGELSRLGGGEDGSLEKYLPVLITQFKDALAPIRKPIALTDVPETAIRAFIEEVAPFMDPERAAMWTCELRFTVALGSYAADSRKPVGDFLGALRGVDSVHLHQYANYIEPIISAFISPDADGRDIVADFASAVVGKYGDIQLKGESVRAAAAYADNGIILRYELERFESLMAIAQAIRNGGFAPGEFHHGREIAISNGWNILEAREKQVAHERIFIPGQQVEFSTGANMSGKSYDEVGLTWSLLFGQATGWLPGSSARIPIFDRIIHIERVQERTDLNLSAFGTEVYYWKSIIPLIMQGGRTYLAADEPFSSTSSRYRNPFNFAVAALGAESDSDIVLATHCQPPVEHFIDANPGRGLATHHETRFDEAGNFSFTYKKMNGIADSYALEVAEALQYPAEILAIARSLPSMSEYEKLGGSAVS